MSKNNIDRDQLARYFGTLLRNAPKGAVVRLCAFPEKDEVGATRIRKVKLVGGVENVVSEAVELADWASRQTARYVVCAPAAAFKGEGGKEPDVVAGLAVCVDLDKNPAKGRKRLERLLGPATLCVKSGGDWGSGKKRQPTLHLYWLLSEPATGSDLALLKKVQRLAVEFADADPTAISYVHSFRCPGTPHRKGKVTMARIVSCRPSVRLDLRRALKRLQRAQKSAAAPVASPTKAQREAPAAPRSSQAAAIKAILRGADYHGSLTSLAMHHALAGMSKTSIEETLRSLMDSVPAKLRDIKEGKSESGRWRKRFAEIPAIAQSAVEKVASSGAWPEPVPLPSLPSVPALKAEMLPARLRAWLLGHAERMQVPVDYIAVSAIAAAGATVGRSVGLQPKPHDPSWIEVANQYACIIGRPGIMKSPCMRKGLAPLLALEARAAKSNQSADTRHKREMEMYQMRKKAAEAKSKTALKKDLTADLSDFVLDPPAQPAHQRHIVHDATFESLGKILADNPRGVMVYRDELSTFLTKLEDKSNADLRGMFLSGWSGHETHSSDRIGRGHVGGNPHCLSMIGSSQPARFADYVRSVQSGRSLDDGMLQRFGLLIYPDEPTTWKNVNIPTNGALDQRAHKTFKRLSGLDGARVRAKHVVDGLPVLQFDKAAQKRFDVWHAKLERRLRSAAIPEALVGHISKYRKLVPGLALIFHLIDFGEGPVGWPALKRAVAWGRYLEAHARRAYGGILQRHVEGARVILDRIAAGKLASPFTERELTRKDWSGLTDDKVTKQALQLLWDHHAVRRLPKGKTYVFEINPKLMPRAMRKA
nr:YfjI family protein [Nitrosomonas nitrosa]